jgi:hypothetical protein
MADEQEDQGEVEPAPMVSLTAASTAAAAGQAQPVVTGPTGSAASPAPPIGPNGPTGPTTTPLSPSGPPIFVPEQSLQPPSRRRPGSSFGALQGSEFVPAPPEPEEDLAVEFGPGGADETSDAPFSETGIAERLAQGEDQYRQLMQSVAAALRRDAENYPVQFGLENSSAVIKAELNATADKFDRAASVLDGKAEDRFATAAKLVVEIRVQFVRFTESYPIFSKVFFDLAGVTLGCLALYRMGVDPNLSALIATSVVQGVKLSENIRAWRGTKNDDK